MSWQERFVRPDSRLPSIYALTDHDGTIRYIGKAKDPENRLARHISEAKFHNRPVHHWIRKNGAPRLIVLEGDVEDWEASERKWIAWARSQGLPLLNVADGGAGPSCSKATRASNGRRVARDRDPVIWKFNRDFGYAHRRGELPARVYPLLHELARLDPLHYGIWRNRHAPR